MSKSIILGLDSRMDSHFLELEPSTENHLQYAAYYLTLAMTGKSTFHHDKLLQNKQKIYRKLTYILLIVLLIYLSLAFFEKPSWCNDTDFYYNCTVEDGISPPMSDLPKLPVIYTSMLDIICITYFIFILIYKKTFTKESSTSHIRKMVILGLIGIEIVDDIQAMVRMDRLYIAQYVRPLVYILIYSPARKCWKRVILMAKDEVLILVLIVMYVCFYGAVGCILFKDTDEGDAYFKNLTEGTWNMLILLTTANFPDVMMPAYEEHRYYCIFFILYIIGGLFFLSNLMIAMFYSNYKTQLQALADQIINLSNSFVILAYETLDTSNLGCIPSETLTQLLYTINHPKLNSQTIPMITQSLSRPPSLIYRSDFLEIIPTVNREYSLYQINLNSTPSEVPQSFVSKLVVSLPYQILQNCVNISCFITFITLNNTDISIEIQLYVMIGYLGVFMIDSVLCMIHYKLGVYKHMFVMGEIVLNLVLLIVLIYYYLVSEAPFEIFEEITLLKLIRVFELLINIQDINILCKTLYSLIPAFTPILSILIGIFYIFSVLGVSIFGGKIYQGISEIDSDALIPSTYIHNNFNDFPSGCLTLFELMIVNNWWVIAKMYTNVTNNWARYYFICYYFVAVLIALNLNIAFVVDSFISQYGKQNSELSEDKEADERKTCVLNKES